VRGKVAQQAVGIVVRPMDDRRDICLRIEHHQPRALAVAVFSMI
jgi:hypothetical protein